MNRVITALLVLLVLVSGSYADPVKKEPEPIKKQPEQTIPEPVKKEVAPIIIVLPGNAIDAMSEVNAVRMARGLAPFVRDDLLTQAAASCAVARANALVAGHTANDFAALPLGSAADAAGCAAWHPSLGWGACATYEDFTHAGAAIVVGADGRRYMHLFVRGRSAVRSSTTTQVSATACAGGSCATVSSKTRTIFRRR